MRMAAEPLQRPAETLPFAAERMPEATTPYLDALTRYAAREPARFHVPGHKGGLAAPPGLARVLGPALALDIPACTRGIDIGGEPTPLAQAERLAAEEWGARRTWFLVGGASEASHAACLAFAHAGSKVVVQRNVHSSTIHGLIVSGLHGHFLAPSTDPGIGVAHCLRPAELGAALDENPDAVAALVVSPTYFGAAADVEGLAHACHVRGVPLMVDEAWGAHFHLHPALPAHALAAGADLVISGSHKLAGSLTQSAMLHLGPRDWAGLDEQLLSRTLGLVQTTSPSSLLLASLDAARAHLAACGAELVEHGLAEIALLKAALVECTGLPVLGQELVGQDGVAAYDPLRLVIDVRAAPADGYELAAALRQAGDIQLELVTDRVLLAHLGIGEPILESGIRLVEALCLVLEGLGRQGARGEPLPAGAPPVARVELEPRDAFFAEHELVSLGEAAGRVSAESIVVYPPGIANILPGERFTQEIVDGISSTLARSPSVRGTWRGPPHPVRVVSQGSAALDRYGTR